MSLSVCPSDPSQPWPFVRSLQLWAGSSRGWTPSLILPGSWCVGPVCPCRVGLSLCLDFVLGWCCYHLKIWFVCSALPIWTKRSLQIHCTKGTSAAEGAVPMVAARRRPHRWFGEGLRRGGLWGRAGRPSSGLGSGCQGRRRRERRRQQRQEHVGQLWEAVSDSGAQSDLLIWHFLCR